MLSMNQSAGGRLDVDQTIVGSIRESKTFDSDQSFVAPAPPS
jgi:hypothetical protein